MTSGLSSPVKAVVPARHLQRGRPSIRGRADLALDVEARMYAFLAETNFYAAAKAGYAELGHVRHRSVRDGRASGSRALSATPDRVGEYYIALGDDNEPDTLYRKAWMSVHQAVQSFGLDKVSQRVKDQYDRSDYEQIVRVWHAIEPNDERDLDVMTAKGKAWRSFWWDEQDGDKKTATSRSRASTISRSGRRAGMRSAATPTARRRAWRRFPT
jgi:hypothetical protein